MNRIVLIGFRGTGKTTIGLTLSGRMEWNYISTDALVEERSGKSIHLIVEEGGWESFRRLEREVIAALRDAVGAVIDCGGGVIEDDRNVGNLVPGALVVWVDATMDDIHDRLSRCGDRPSLTDPDLRRDIEHHYTRRRPIYRGLCHLRADTSRESVEEICSGILELLKEGDVDR